MYIHVFNVLVYTCTCIQCTCTCIYNVHVHTCIQCTCSLLELVCYNTSTDMEYDDEILR